MELILELVRATDGDDEHAFRFGPQEYLLRTPGGRYKTTTLDWNDALQADLRALCSSDFDAALVQRMGDRMRRFVSPGIWGLMEAGIARAKAAGDPIRMTVRSAAAELYRLPWELLTLETTGQHIGELPELLIRYAWPETVTVGSPDSNPTERMLFAWSAAGGSVPAVDHQDVIPLACDVLEHTSWSRLRHALRAAEDDDAPITALHLLCHSEERDGTMGLVWNDDNADRAWISAANLRQLLEPFTHSLRLLILCACYSSDSGARGNHLGGLAQAVHRIGVPWVVGARYPLGKRASVEFARAFHCALADEPHSVELAFLSARDRLLSSSFHRSHWTGMRLYARPPIGSATASLEPNDSEPIRHLVDDLVNRLAELRHMSANREPTGELSERIDDLVRAIKRRFSPDEGANVAGAVLLRVIGTGNFGTIWHGEQLDTGERVAVKVVRLERLAEGQMLSRFRRSIRAMRLLSEDRRQARRVDTRGHIVRFRDEDESGLAFAMDYLSKGNLENVEQHGWAQERKLEVMLSVCGAVRYAHANGVIHRDIKPANIVLDVRRQPVLTDFDIADIKWATSLSTTVEGGLGTPVFAAPEQLVDADTATERADIYSLGRLLYYMLLERSPGYEVEKDPSLPNLSGERPALVEIVRRATQYEPMRRYTSVAEMMRDLESCHTGAAAVRARMARMGRWVKRNRALLVIAVLLLGGSVGFSVYQGQVAKTERAHRARAQRAEADALRIAEEVARLADDVAEAKNREGALSKRIDERDRKLSALEERRRGMPTPDDAARLDMAIASTKAERERDWRALEEVRAELERFDEDLKKRAREVRQQEAARIQAEKATPALTARSRAARAWADSGTSESSDYVSGAGDVLSTGTLLIQANQANAVAHVYPTEGKRVGPIELPADALRLLAGEYTVVVVSGSSWFSDRVTITAGEVSRLAAQPRRYWPSGRSQGVVHTALKDTDAPMEFIGLSAGEFTMGSPPAESRYNDDETLHRVRLSAFELGRTEVTQKQWYIVMGTEPSDCQYGCGDERPVQNVSWNQAVEFLNRMSEREQLIPCYTHSGADVRWSTMCDGYRLPTEAEWEYACRAGTTSATSVGDGTSSLGGHAWYGDNSGREVHPVGRRKPNPWKLRDMHGNVWEWVWDRDGPYPLALEPAHNPRASSRWGRRVMRGGSIVHRAAGLRCANRLGVTPGVGHGIGGLRAARGSRRQH